MVSTGGRTAGFRLCELPGLLVSKREESVLFVASQATDSQRGFRSYSEPGFNSGSSPSPSLGPPSLSSPHDTVSDIILGPFLFAIQFLMPCPISCYVGCELFQGKEKKPTQTNSNAGGQFTGRKKGLGKELRAEMQAGSLGSGRLQDERGGRRPFPFFSEGTWPLVLPSLCPSVSSLSFSHSSFSFFSLWYLLR